MSDEGWTPEHDDAHDRGELAAAARCYEWHSDTTINTGRVCRNPPPSWPWDRKWWKPTKDPVRGYEKAGALYKAESDRLLRLERISDAVDMEEKAHAIAAKIDALLTRVPAMNDTEIIDWIERNPAAISITVIRKDSFGRKVYWRGPDGHCCETLRECVERAKRQYPKS